MRSRTNQLSTRPIVLGFFAILALIAIAMIGAHFGARPIVAADTPNGPTKRVIVTFKNVTPVSSKATQSRQQQAIEAVDSTVSNNLPYSNGYKLKTRGYENLPYAAYTVDAEGEASLRADPNVVSVVEDALSSPSMYQALPAIGGSTTTGFSDGTTNYTGINQAVAILDTGVRSTHSMLTGKVIAEACFNTTTTTSGYTSTSRCPGAVESSTATGSAADCVEAVATGCGHGTHVASLAAGASGGSTVGGNPVTISGSAKAAKIIAVNVFSEIVGVSACGSSNPCVLSFSSDQLAALNYILDGVIADSFSASVAAVNMSLGGSPFYSDQAQCDAYSSAAPLNTIFGTLSTNGVATIISAGNNGGDAGKEDKIATPACLSNAIAVGSTNKAGTAIASYSNNGPLVELLSPGGDFVSVTEEAILGASSDSDSALTFKQGTSMAAPVAAGSFAVLREKHPNATVAQLLSLLQTTGTPITDVRSGYTVGAKPKINVATALTNSPYAAIASFTGPTGSVNEGETMTLAATVTNATACSLNNGVGAVTITGGAISRSVPTAASYILTCNNLYNDVVTSTFNADYNLAPSVPVIDLDEFDETARTMTISWAASTDTDDIEEYQVYLNSQLITTLPASTTTYTFTNLMPGVSYSAEVRAVDTLGAVSSAGSLDFSMGAITGENGGTGSPTAPNTGVFSLITDAPLRSALIAGLGLLIALGAVFVARKQRANR